MKLYVAGKMTGEPWHNFPAFDAATDWLTSLGFEIVSPAELDDPQQRAAALASADGTLAGESTWGDLLARDVKLIADVVDGVVLLPGWENSNGARLEAFICRLVGKPVFYLNRGPYRVQDYSRPDWPPGATVRYEQVEHELLYDPTVLLIELDDTELDAHLTMGDLLAMVKIEHDRVEREVREERA